MTVGDPVLWCRHCGGFFPVGLHNSCAGHWPGLGRNYANYVPQPDTFSGAQVVPILTEADVRRIVREELAALGAPK